jgi:anaerobic magnesium-protoporphyrin IX monomethyl ester cyclase
MGHPRLELMLSRLQRTHRHEFFGTDNQEEPYQVTDSGLLSLSSYLRQAGFSTAYFFPDTRGYDSAHFLHNYCNELETFLRNNEVRYIAFGPHTCAYPTAQAIARRARTISPNSRIIFGGQHATFLDAQLLTEAPFIDLVVRREGERPLASLLRTPDSNPVTEALGVTYRRGDTVKRNPDGRPLETSEIPPQDYECLPSWLKEFDVLLNIPIGRGCPWRCFFCTESAFWGKPRQRTAGKVAEEISMSLSRLRVKEIRFSDDTFTFNRSLPAELVTELRNHGIDLQTVQILTRADTVNREVLTQISGLAREVEIWYGVESGSEEVLKEMRKGITVDQVIRALQKTKELGIYSVCFWIVGHPGSSVQKEKVTTDLMCKLIDENLCSAHQVSVFQPYPGSEAFQSPLRSGVVMDSYEWNRYVEQPPMFPPVSHLVNFSSIEIMLAYLERRARHYEHLCKQMGIDWNEV